MVCSTTKQVISPCICSCRCSPVYNLHIILSATIAINNSPPEQVCPRCIYCYLRILIIWSQAEISDITRSVDPGPGTQTHRSSICPHCIRLVRTTAYILVTTCICRCGRLPSGDDYIIVSISTYTQLTGYCPGKCICSKRNIRHNCYRIILVNICYPSRTCPPS